MRHDVLGLFWDDTPPPRKTKDAVKRTPPPRTWEADDYLPGLQEALDYVPTTYNTHYIRRGSYSSRMCLTLSPTLIFGASHSPTVLLENVYSLKTVRGFNLIVLRCCGC
jgi:hypothetical protein